MNKIQLTQDGSTTIDSGQFGVPYHSKYGALQETETVFLEAGFKFFLQNHDPANIKIFEMGFGTGLNALMTFLLADNYETTIDYHTIEAYPIDDDMVSALNYPSVLNLTNEQEKAFHRMHSSESQETVQLSDKFSFTKHLEKLEDFSGMQEVDVIYYDAFAPNAQENLWTPSMMEKLYSFFSQRGILVTYCAKGSFKRALKHAGFLVEGIPGPIGKREMTRALVSEI